MTIEHEYQQLFSSRNKILTSDHQRFVQRLVQTLIQQRKHPAPPPASALQQKQADNLKKTIDALTEHQRDLEKSIRKLERENAILEQRRDALSDKLLNSVENVIAQLQQQGVSSRKKKPKTTVTLEDSEVLIVGADLPTPEQQVPPSINVAQAHDLATQTHAFLQQWSSGSSAEQPTTSSNWTNVLSPDEKDVWTLATQQGHIKKSDATLHVATPLELMVFNINDRYWSANPDATSDILIEEHDRWLLNYVHP